MVQKNLANLGGTSLDLFLFPANNIGSEGCRVGKFLSALWLKLRTHKESGKTSAKRASKLAIFPYIVGFFGNNVHYNIWRID